MDWQNYDIVEKPEDRISLDTHLATCKRGRLRRRIVVLKKVLSPVILLLRLAPMLLHCD